MAAQLARPRARRYRAIAGVFLVVAAVGAAVVLFASPFLIQSVSMTSTIEPGQYVLVDRVGPSLGLQRGEVVLFTPPANVSKTPFIKRVIGLPGDRVAIHGGEVYVNDVQIAESYLAPGTTTKAVHDGYDTIRVPAGSVFVLGDDRSESWDSRYFGPVPEGSIIGRAWMILSPTSLSIAML